MAAPFTLIIFSGVFISVFVPALTSPRTTVTEGELVGTWMTSRGGRTFAAFKGIPYAAPPIGELRFKSPKAAKPWIGVRNASMDGEVCVQPHPYYRIHGREDCLFLNVYTPNVTNVSKLPVLFFIHGGFFKLKSGHQFFYDPKYLLDEDIVFVTINYRLGVYGFLSFDNKALPGNFGLKDQREALRWVKHNIANFGGDPNKVTLFGENAGAASVHYHLLFNTEEGLFRAGILHSGSALTAGSFQRPGDQKPLIEHILNNTNCTLQSIDETVECIKSFPSSLLAYIFEQFKYTNDSMFRKVELSPVIEPDCVEDAFVTDNPWNKTSSLPMIIGTNKFEGIISVIDLLRDNKNEKFEHFNSNFEELLPYNLMFNTSAEDPQGVAQQIKEFYLKDAKFDREHAVELINLMSDGLFNYGTMKAVQNNMKHSYLYSFNYKGSKSFVDILDYTNTYGPTNLDEFLLFFPLFTKSEISEEDKKLSVKLIKIWTEFAANIDTTPLGIGFEWKPAGADLEYLNINGPENFTMDSHFYKDRMDFWDKLPLRSKPLPASDALGCVE